ncbi:Superoxide dismutase [Cu-Zn]-like 1 [Homarus americanus]|uniref:Superoxide dismutase [Cu-Zn]-like 1 n=2 Tax=Homarus americanus TaxID=6706 RepID=A0A8J5N406_HOMAM|nr:Superoxide dismutase [Cu-Zn]-like 1 [Homarus americanus]
MLGCSRLFRSQPRRAVAHFTPTTVGGVGGRVEVYQVSPLDHVKLSINLTLPRGNAAAFGIDNFAIGDRISCTGLSRRFYEPWYVDLDLTPAPQQGTKDLYPAGDLSGKFGTLISLKEAAATLTDPTITLFGEHSVIGRGVAVYDPSWRVVGCADLKSEVPQVNAVAVFSGAISGVLRLSQPMDSIFSETIVYLRLYRTGGKDSAGHTWHIHTQSLDENGKCSSAGGHFNPFFTNLTDRQKYNGTPLPHTAYEVGDLHGKHGEVTIPGPRTSQRDLSSGRYQWTDEWLPLLGEASVLNKALVVHDADGDAARVACANIVMEEITG